MNLSDGHAALATTRITLAPMVAASPTRVWCPEPANRSFAVVSGVLGASFLLLPLLAVGGVAV